MEDNSTGVGTVNIHPVVAASNVPVSGGGGGNSGGRGGGNSGRRRGSGGETHATSSNAQGWRSGGTHFTNATTEPTWTGNLENLISMYRDKCSQRILVHRQSANYYSLRLRYVTIPAGVLGGLATSTVLSTWKSDFCGSPWLQYISLASGICMLGALVLGTVASKSNYSPLYESHLNSYRNFDKLLKRLTVELCFEPQYRALPREFVDTVLREYDRYSDEAELVPSSVEKSVRKAIEEASERYRMHAIDLEQGLTAREVVESDMSDEDKAAYFHVRSLGSQSRNNNNNNDVVGNFQQDPNSPPHADDVALQDVYNRRLSGVAVTPDEVVEATNAARRRWKQLAKDARKRRVEKTRYCRGMPITSVIELNPLTFKEQSEELDNRMQYEPFPQRENTFTAEFFQSATALHPFPAEDVPSAKTTAAVNANNEQSHQELVRSAMVRGMNDMAASHPSSNSGTPPPPVASALSSHNNQTPTSKSNDAKNADKSCSDCSHGHTESEMDDEAANSARTPRRNKRKKSGRKTKP